MSLRKSEASTGSASAAFAFLSASSGKLGSQWRSFSHWKVIMWWVRTRVHQTKFSTYKAALVYFHNTKGTAIYWEPPHA